LILIRTKMRFWTGGPHMMNLGLEEYDVRAIQKVTVSGFANNRSMTFHLVDGKKQTLRISPWFKPLSGTKAFFDAVPQLISSGQLAQQAGQAFAASGPSPQLAAGYAQQPQQPGYGPPPQQAYAAPPMQQAYAAPPPQEAYAAPPMQQAYGAPPPPSGGFSQGARVQVAAPDGHRYPATIVHEQNGQYLCAMPNGQQHWFPASSVAPG
jgi:hypothetical protein